MPDSTFYAAMVNSTDNVWNSSFERTDFDIVSFDLDHEEAKKPTLTLTVRNPQIGLLNVGRPTWLWFAWYNKLLGVVEPLFFGHIISLPTNLLGPQVDIVYISDPQDFLAQKQTIAEAKKKRPNYDPLCLDPAHRDDPDSILEGYSEDWHIDRFSKYVTTSDIIYGEDGIEVFAQEEVPFDSVSLDIAVAPKTLVEVKMTTQWTQKSTDFIDMGTRTFLTYAMDAFIQNWPNPNTNLGQGWSVSDSRVVDVDGTMQAQTQTITSNYTNRDKVHNDGDVLSANVSWTIPQQGGGGGAFVPFRPVGPGGSEPLGGQGYIVGEANTVEVTTSWNVQVGFLDPFAVDGNGDPDPTNIPAHTEVHYAYGLGGAVQGFIQLRGDANRPRTETLTFIMKSDLQQVVEIQDVPTNTEIITIPVANVDQPLLDVKEWQTVAGTFVKQGTVILVPVSIAPLEFAINYQIALNSGVAGIVEPDFSNLMGVQTVDNAVIWVGLGEQPPGVPLGWRPGNSTPQGEIILPTAQVTTAYSALVAFYPPPSSGVSVSVGRIIRRNNGASYQMCTAPGTTGTFEPNFSDTRGAVTADGTVLWTCLGSSANDGATFWMAISVTGSVTGTLVPNFTGVAGTTIVDGGVVWQSLGNAGNFIGIPIGDVSRSQYFPLDRGHWTIEHGLCIARNHLLASSRIAKAGWNIRAERFSTLSCRKNAQLFDPRFPGGQLLGKITKYTMHGDGATGVIIATVQIECAAGSATVITADQGDSDYVDEDYVEDGYQETIGNIIVPITDDLGYSFPAQGPTDDGLVFPLTYPQAVIVDHIVGSGPGSGNIASGLHSDNDPPQVNPFGGGIATKSSGTYAHILQEFPQYWEFVLTPLTGQTFNTEYDLGQVDLSVLKLVDLSAPHA